MEITGLICDREVSTAIRVPLSTDMSVKDIFPNQLQCGYLTFTRNKEENERVYIELSWRTARVPGGSQVFVETIQGPHVLVGDFKIEDVGVFPDAGRVGRFGNDHQIMLDGPADQDLRRRFGFLAAGSAGEKRKLRHAAGRR